MRAAAELGTTKIRLTGGEPTIRPGVVELVRSIQDQVVQLRDQNRNLVRRLDEESNARRRLEGMLRNHSAVHNFDDE